MVIASGKLLELFRNRCLVSYWGLRETGAWPPFCIHQQYVFTYFPLGYFFPISELKELVDLHKESTDANEDPLRDDEVMIIQVAKQILLNSPPLSLYGK